MTEEEINKIKENIEVVVPINDQECFLRPIWLSDEESKFDKTSSPFMEAEHKTRHNYDK